jgi:hypothetical protein
LATPAGRRVSSRPRSRAAIGPSLPPKRKRSSTGSPSTLGPG